MNNSEHFIELYKELENTVREIYKINDGDSISHYLANNSKYKRNSNEIKYCQRVRNLLQHNTKINNEFSVVPSDDMIFFLKKLIKDISNRLQAKDVSINLNSIYFKAMGDRVDQAMIRMKRDNYTHIPILEENVVKGVFDENAVFNYIADEEIITFEHTKFIDLEQYLSLDNRETVTFDFVSPNDYVEDILKKFECNLSKDVRLGMIFVTPSGKRTEKITGIITPWDILGSSSL